MTTSTASFYREPPRRDLLLWIVAGLVIAALHVAIVAFLLHRQPKEPPPTTAETIEIQLDAIDAPAPQADQVAPPPPQEEQQPLTTPPPEPPPPTQMTTPEPIVPPPPPPPEAVAPPDDMPPPETVPILPKVEVPIEPKPDPAIEQQKKLEQQKKVEAKRREEIRQKQDEARKEEERRKAVEAKRQEKIKAKQEAARAQQAQERREAAAQSRAAASRERAAQRGAASQASAASMNAWKASVAAQIRANVSGGGASGRAVVSFTVTRGGGIVGVHASGEAGSTAAAAVRGVGAVAPPPDGQAHPVSVPITFR